MKLKAIAILALAALIMAFAAPLNAAPAEKTMICHFPNHWAYLGPPHNYAVFDWMVTDGQSCLDVGGKVIEVSDKALKGHRVEADELFPGQFDKCIICHYPSHVAENGWFDAVLTRGAGGACFNNGGKVMVVSCSAIYGHDAFCFRDAPDWPNCPYNQAPLP